MPEPLEVERAVLDLLDGRSVDPAPLLEVDPRRLLRETGVRIRRYRIKGVGTLIVLSYKDAWVRSWTRFARECRGLSLLVARDGAVEVVARPFPKFFNVGEADETQLYRLARMRLVEAARKRDGTLIIAGYSERLGWLLSTRSVPMFADPFDTRPDVEVSDPRRVRNPYVRRAIELADPLEPRRLEDVAEGLEHLTLLFEAVDTVEPVAVDPQKRVPVWLSPETARQRTEVGVRGVWFITARRKSDGYVLRYSEAAGLGLPLRQVELVEVASLSEAIARAGRGEFGEGLVLRFEGARKEEFVLVKAKDFTLVESVLQRFGAATLLVYGGIDDVLPRLSPSEREKIDRLRRLVPELLSVLDDLRTKLGKRPAIVEAARSGDAKRLRTLLRSMGLPLLGGANLVAKLLEPEGVREVAVALLSKHRPEELERIVEKLRTATAR